MVQDNYNSIKHNKYMAHTLVTGIGYSLSWVTIQIVTFCMCSWISLENNTIQLYQGYRPKMLETRACSCFFCNSILGSISFLFDLLNFGQISCICLMKIWQNCYTCVNENYGNRIPQSILLFDYLVRLHHCSRLSAHAHV